MDEPWVGEPLSQRESTTNTTPQKGQSQHHCAACRKWFANAATLATHLESAKHKQREVRRRKGWRCADEENARSRRAKRAVRGEARAKR